LPDVALPTQFRDFLRRAPEGGTRLLLSPEATQRIEDVPRPERGATVLIGPEGGLSEEEQQDAQSSGFTAVRLGPRILRTETAAIAAITLLQREFGDL
jgi:16S rRNA (uracil1498-N3)-methyltransferase